MGDVRTDSRLTQGGSLGESDLLGLEELLTEGELKIREGGADHSRGRWNHA
jgi:hypothetical protein